MIPTQYYNPMLFLPNCERNEEYCVQLPVFGWLNFWERPKNAFISNTFKCVSFL